MLNSQVFELLKGTQPMHAPIFQVINMHPGAFPTTTVQE